MAEPFIGQIVMFGGNFAPRGWALCDGQLLPITQNTALFSILGTTYGGDGRTTFGLPDLRGRVPIHEGNGPGLSSYNLGQKGGAEEFNLTTNQLPSHNHTVYAVDEGGNNASPDGGLPAIESTGTSKNFSDGTSIKSMKSNMIGNTGGNQPVSVIQPYQCVNFIIALEGIFPSRN